MAEERMYARSVQVAHPRSRREGKAAVHAKVTAVDTVHKSGTEQAPEQFSAPEQPDLL